MQSGEKEDHKDAIIVFSVQFYMRELAHKNMMNCVYFIFAF